MLKTGLLIGFICGIALFSACEHQPYVLPVSERTGDSALCFDRDLLPIFISQCAKSGCHDAGTHKKGYILDSYDNIIKKGIVPGNYAASRIYMSVTGTTEEMMPKGADNLTEEQITLIKRWIVKGAIKDNNCTPLCDSDNYVFSAGVQPIVNKYCTGCHSGSAPQGNLLLTSYSEIKGAVQSRNLIKCINYETGYPGMPNSGLHLSTCQIRQIEKWVSAGMLNN
ncbi:MAG: hypothetical protein JST82_10060 [Bacteroidetes bacterium]|nr:hypothetical protein [Bacteroidota bacterium]